MNMKTHSYKVTLKVLFIDERPFVILKPIDLVTVVKAENFTDAVNRAVEKLTEDYPELTHNNIIKVEIIKL